MTKKPSPVDPKLFQLMADSVRDYAIFLLDPQGNIMTWNPGAERAKQYKADEIIGRHFSIFYTAADIERNWPAHELQRATMEGRFEDEGWRVRKDGTRFWASVVITALRGEKGKLLAFSKITRDLSQRRDQEARLRRSERRRGCVGLGAGGGPRSSTPGSLRDRPGRSFAGAPSDTTTGTSNM